MTWEERYRAPAEDVPRRLKPNIFARLARLAFRYPLTIIALWVMLAIPALVFTVTAMRIDLSDSVLATADPVLAGEQDRLNAEFPEPSESIVAVIDSKDPRLARSGAERMATRMGEAASVFRNVFAPGTGRFFDDNGILYLNEEQVSAMVARIERSAPLFQALAASPNLTGLSVLADQAAKTVAGGRSPDGLNALFLDAARTVQAEIVGKRRELDWPSLIEHGVNIESQRWYVLSYPVPTSDADPTRHAVEEAQRLAAQVAGELGGQVSVNLTGRPVLRAMTPPIDIRALLLPGLLSSVVLLVILGFGLSRAGAVVIVLVAAALTFAISTSLALAAIGYFDRVSVTYPVLFAALFALTVIGITLRGDEAENAGLPKVASLMLAGQALGGALLAWLIGVAAGGLATFGGEFRALQRLSIVVAIMCAVIFLAAVTLLPALLSLLRPQSLETEEEDEQVHWLDGLMATPATYTWWSLRRGLAATLIAAAVLCALLVPAAQFESPSILPQSGASAAERLFRELSAREPSLRASGEILVEPGDPARQLVRRLATLPEVEGVRWVEAFLPSGEADKRAILAKLEGVFPRNTAAVDDTSDDILRTQFIKLQDGLRRIAAEPTAPADLASAANEFRRSLALLDGNGLAPPERLRQLERSLFVKLQLLLDRIDRLSHLESLTVERLDPSIYRQFVSRGGLWRIEVQPRRPDDIEDFAAALRSATSAATGMALIEADRLAAMRAAMPTFLGGWLALAVFVPLIAFRSFRKMLRILLPVVTALLLGLGVTAMTGISLYPESVTIFMLLICFTLGAATIAEGWYGAQPPGQWPRASSRPRALLLSVAILLAAFAPLTLSPLQAVRQFGTLLLIAVAVSFLGLFILLPQLRAWTAPRRRRDDYEES